MLLYHRLQAELAELRQHTVDQGEVQRLRDALEDTKKAEAG